MENYQEEVWGLGREGIGQGALTGLLLKASQGDQMSPREWWGMTI